MEQLNFFDYIANAQKKAAVKIKKIVSRIKTIASKPDLEISIDKNGKFHSTDEFGLVKLEMIERCGILEGWVRLENINALKYVRGENESLKMLDDSVISYGFAPAAGKKIASLKKEFKRKNIALRVDVGKEELVV